MKPVDVIEGLDRIDPRSLAAYLAERGWSRRGKALPGVETWVHRRLAKEPTPSVLLPLDRQLADFVPLMKRAFEAVAQSEGRPIDELLIDVLEPSSAVMRMGVQLEGHPDAGVPLGVAAAMLETLLRAASAAAEEAALSLEGPEPWRRTAARAYLARVRLAHTEPGSYVMKVVLPDKLIADEPSRGGSVAERLVAELRRLKEVATSRQPLAEAVERLQYWDFGSQVIHAIARVEDEALESVFLEVRVGRDHQQRRGESLDLGREGRHRLQELDHLLPTAAAQAVREADVALRPPTAAQHIPNVSLEGNVIRLARPDITVLTSLEQRERRIRAVRVPPHLYELAYRAHGQESRVRLVGTLIVRGTQLEMREVTHMELLDA